ncbi:MAG TPA: TIGR03118 family protein [Phycisphaerae bacterium]
MIRFGCHRTFVSAAAAIIGVTLTLCPVSAQFYEVHNFVSDGFVAADHTIDGFVNAWGIDAGPTTFWWVAINGEGTARLIDGSGNPQSLVVTIPAPEGSSEPSTPTGIVFNGTSDFVVSDGTNSAPSRFIFVTEDGTIAAWAPTVPPPPPSHQAFIVVDDSDEGAIYKGAALGNNGSANFLYVTNFHEGTVDTYDGNFAEVDTPGGFVDATIPQGFAPFGIRNLDGELFVTYAMQDEDAEDDVAGPGLGYVNVFDTNGNLLRRFVSRGKLNAPWGIAAAPANFGLFSNDILIGNFGDGRINAYNRSNGTFRGRLRQPNGQPIEIDGLWGISFGNGTMAGPTNTLFFAAGPDDEEHGLFGSITAVSGNGNGNGNGDDD